MVWLVHFMLAFSQEDPGSAARLVKDFAKQNDLLVVKMISIGGELFDASELSRSYLAYLLKTRLLVYLWLL